MTFVETSNLAAPLLKWSPDRIERLTALWRQGFSATQIGADLGITRNAALGKIHRLGKAKDCPQIKAKPFHHVALRKPRGLSDHRPPALTRAQRAVAQRARRIAQLFSVSAETLPTAALEAPAGQGCSLQDLTDTTCRFPNGDPALPAFHFCGADKPSATPYCRFHHSVTHQQQSSRAPVTPFITWGR